MYKEISDLFQLRVWGFKTYYKFPKAYLRKDFRNKCYVGYLMGYSDEGKVGYKVFIPDLNEVGALSFR